MTVRVTLEITGPITEDDKLILTSTMVSLLAITNTVMGTSPTEDEGEEEEPPPSPPGGLN